MCESIDDAFIDVQACLYHLQMKNLFELPNNNILHV